MLLSYVAVKNIFIYLLCGFFLVAYKEGEACIVGASKQNNCSTLEKFTLADSAHPLDFNHYCSGKGLSYSGYWEAYALFESQDNSNKKAIVVGSVVVGWFGIKLNLNKFQMRSFRHWAGHRLGIALQIVNLRTGQIVIGEFATSFSHTRNSLYGDTEYQMSLRGDLDWENFTEPEVEDRTSKERREKKSSKGILISSQNLSYPQDNHSLYLLVENRNTGNTIVLNGPVIEDLEKRLKVKRPDLNELGCLQVLNPFQTAGLWDWLRHAFRYNDCIYLTKQSKYEFNMRWKAYEKLKAQHAQ